MTLQPLLAIALTLFASMCLGDEPAKPQRPLAEIGPKPHPVEPPNTPSHRRLHPPRRRIPAGRPAARRLLGQRGTDERSQYLRPPYPARIMPFAQRRRPSAFPALLDVEDSRPEVATAIDRGEAWLLEHLPSLRRAEPTAIYNTSGDTPSRSRPSSSSTRIDRATLQSRPSFASRSSSRSSCSNRYETVNGGWGLLRFYYGPHQKARGRGRTSFTPLPRCCWRSTMPKKSASTCRKS